VPPGRRHTLCLACWCRCCGEHAVVGCGDPACGVWRNGVSASKSGQLQVVLLCWHARQAIQQAVTRHRLQVLPLTRHPVRAWYRCR
jgi:hypothetical protein